MNFSVIYFYLKNVTVIIETRKGTSAFEISILLLYDDIAWALSLIPFMFISFVRRIQMASNGCLAKRSREEEEIIIFSILFILHWPIVGAVFIDWQFITSSMNCHSRYYRFDALARKTQYIGYIVLVWFTRNHAWISSAGLKCYSYFRFFLRHTTFEVSIPTILSISSVTARVWTLDDIINNNSIHHSSA